MGGHPGFPNAISQRPFVITLGETDKSGEAYGIEQRVGHKRADCLAHTLGDAGIQVIIATGLVRTQQTANLWPRSWV
jgi:hypothetical protein